ncbi:DMT family transporter [Acetobacteraceae bacterium ESL0709]|nr:DMT family transporter [Acetobacteraceae bacterium ESL0709]
MRLSQATIGLLLALAGFASFAISDMFSKLLAGHLNPFEVAFSGGAFGLLLLPLVKRKHESYVDAVPHKSEIPLWLLRALAVFTATAVSVEAFMLLSMPEALSLMFLMPFMANILSAVFLKEHISWASWLSVFIGFIGVLIVLRPGIRPFNLGYACALISALANAVSVVAYKVAAGKTSRLELLSSTLAGPLIGNGLLMMGHFSWPRDLTSWVNLFGYGFLAALGQLCLMLAAQKTPASRVSLSQYSQMIWAVLFSQTIFHDHMDRWTVLGVLVVTFSGTVNWLCRYMVLVMSGGFTNAREARRHRNIVLSRSQQIRK